MPLIKKICLLGAYAVGKTSLVRRYVHSVFDDKYLSTVGVKITKHTTQAADVDLTMMIWDLYGEDAFQKVKTSYFRGAAGFIVVADGTRRETGEVAQRLRHLAIETVGRKSTVIVVNKGDLKDRWEITEGDLDELRSTGDPVVTTSALSGSGVREVFDQLALTMVGGKAP